VTSSLREGARALRRVARESGPLWAATVAVDRLGPLGIQRLWPSRRVPAETLERQLAAVFASWGMCDEHVATTAAMVLYADLRAIDSHGSGMLPFYHRQLVAGRLEPSPRIEVVREKAATALLDGGGGLGHVPACRAMRLAVEKARTSGTAAVAVRNSGHFGAAGAYARIAAAQGMLGVVKTSTPTPAVVPTRGIDPLLGTNPIAFAAPARRHPPFLLDMATSTVSLGKLLERWRRGRSLPAGWALDREGRPATNGWSAHAGRRLTPLGGTPLLGSHKGYGLATAVEILSAVLPGLRRERGGSRPGPREVGHFFLAVDPASLREDGAFADDLDELIDALHATPALEPGQPVLVAGDPEEAALAERSARGIPLSRAVLEGIRGVAASSGAPFLLDGR
jgi:LDH2 family malate/lactate/ureidoglycolate dehydrogenase